MKSSGKKLSLPAYDDIFSTEESRVDDAREKVVQIPLSELHSFAEHGVYLGKTSNCLNVGEVNYGVDFVELDGELWVRKDIRKNFDDLMDEMDSCDEILIKVPVI